MTTGPTDVVLVPHDLTEFSDAGLDVASRLGAIGHLHVVHVLPRLDLTHPTVIWPAEEDEPRRRHARTALGARLQGTPYGQATLHVVVGDPGSRVVELAREIGASLVVMPTHGRTGVGRLLLGSVAEHVVRFAPCPVLVVPAAATPAWKVAPAPVATATQPSDQAEVVALEILDRVGEHKGQFLTAARIAVPTGADARWWEDTIERRLMDSGVEFVDLVIAPGPSAEPSILDLRFEERFV